MDFNRALGLLKDGKKVSNENFIKGENCPIQYKYIYLCDVTREFKKVIKFKDEEKVKIYDYSLASCEILNEEWYEWENNMKNKELEKGYEKLIRDTIAKGIYN